MEIEAWQGLARRLVAWQDKAMVSQDYESLSVVAYQVGALPGGARPC